MCPRGNHSQENRMICSVGHHVQDADNRNKGDVDWKVEEQPTQIN